MMVPDGALVLFACLLLLFTAVSILLEQYKKRIDTFFTKKIPLLIKVHRDTVIKAAVVTLVILFVKKLLYYVPLFGIMQTKFSVWCVDEKIINFLFYIFMLYLLGAGVIGYYKFANKLNWHGGCVGVLISLFLLWLYLTIPVVESFGIKSLTFDQGLILIVCTPLLLLKMFCSGKYLGLFTSFLLGYFTIHRYKKLKPEITKNNAKFLIAPLVILLVLMFSAYFIYKGDWQERFRDHVRSVDNPDAVVHLLDAVNTIPGVEHKSNALKEITAAITRTGDSQWQREIFPRVIKMVKTIKDPIQQYHVLKEIALLIAAAGDIQMAIRTTNNIGIARIRFHALMEVADAVSITTGKKGREEILKQAIQAARTLFRTEKLPAFKEMALIVAKTGHREWSGETIGQLFDMVKEIKGDIKKSAVLAETAVAAASAGDSECAALIAALIPDTEVKNNTLKEIRVK
ncbi:MAG: hypothetical protein JSV88_25655 [Candidatus Aminicenantes bacterium]|nr:MAG: hypothetical protein JSV88_25655 [Candidatus Aminicenantes bacterium]